MSFASLAPLADRASLFTALRQDQLVTTTASLGEHRWDADLSAGTLTFTAEADPSRRIVTRAHLVATIAPGPRSLMWAWAHPQGDGEGPAAALREYGTQHGIAELAQPEVAFPAEVAADPQEWIDQAAHEIGGVAVEITGRSPYFSAPAGAGTRAVFLLDDAVAPLTVAAAMAALPRMLAQIAPADPRSSVWDLSRLAGWQLTWADEAFSAAIVTDATGSATISFDEYARISGIEASLSAV